uniref:Uncharacterized protein n=1 Tax=Candidozyma auris TaxID=498019 RepID=A0A0L0P7D5_CANAR
MRRLAQFRGCPDLEERGRQETLEKGTKEEEEGERNCPPSKGRHWDLALHDHSTLLF